MRNSYPWIVCVALVAAGGFFLGRNVESRVQNQVTSVVPGAPHGHSCGRNAETSGQAAIAARLESKLEDPNSALGNANVPDARAVTWADEEQSAAETSQRALFPEAPSQSQSAKPELSRLHKAYRVSCQFDPGSSALISGNTFTINAANWQGGVIGYDVIEPETGRTTMTGSVGATGSSKGMADMQMIKSAAGISFSGVMPNGDLIVTTIFADKNARGANLAVMSNHGASSGHIATQFYGACDVP